jgi:hypothetical protein
MLRQPLGVPQRNGTNCARQLADAFGGAAAAGPGSFAALQAAQAFDAETLRLARANPGFVAELEAAFDLFLESPATRRA